MAACGVRQSRTEQITWTRSDAENGTLTKPRNTREEKLLLPELGLLVAAEACGEKRFQTLHGRKNLVRTSQRPIADLFNGNGSDQIYGKAFAVGRRQFRSHAGAASGIRIPIADEVVGTALDHIEVEGDDLADDAAEAIEVRHFPVAEVRDFIAIEVFLFVFGGIVSAVAELLLDKGYEPSPPKLCATFAKIHRTG